MSRIRHLRNVKLYKHLYESYTLRPVAESTKILASRNKTNIDLHHNYSIYKHTHGIGAHQIICDHRSAICCSEQDRYKLWSSGSCGSQFIHTSQTVLDDVDNNNNNNNEDNGDEPEDDKEEPEPPRKSKGFVKIVDVETSKRYLKSEAYKTTYGSEPVWVIYRRNFKGQFAPKTTRPSCILKGYMISGNPCPICRDEYLVVDFTNVDLLRQFVSPYTDKVLETRFTNICQKQQRNIEVSIEKARLHGLLPFYVPFRTYNYRDYYDVTSE